MNQFMYRTVLSAAVIVASVCSPSLVSAFEGVISFKSSYWGEESEFQYYSKDERTRIETRRARHGRAAVIMDLKVKKVSMLLLNLRLAMVMNLNTASLLASSGAAGGLTKTGNVHTVLGYRAEQWFRRGRKKYRNLGHNRTWSFYRTASDLLDVWSHRGRTALGTRVERAGDLPIDRHPKG